METPILNNHLKRQYILLGKKRDIDAVSLDLQHQGETAKYLCCIDYCGKEYITIDQCIEICLSNQFMVVWNVSIICDEILERLKKNNIHVKDLNDMFMQSENRACHYEEMYVDRYGKVHCCCKTYLNNVIGHLSDPDISEKIRNYIPIHECVCSKGRLSSATQLKVPSNPGLASIELSSLCNAQCTYCFQNDENKGCDYEYYDELLKMICDLGMTKLIFAGGEILIQPKSIDFLKKLRRMKPDIWIHLKSNGCHEVEKIQIVENIFDSITITLNGFSNSTVSSIMRTSFERTKEFCEQLCCRKSVAVGLKFLASPVNVCEIPEFLKWSISLKPERIIVPSARVYECKENTPTEWLGSTFNGLNMAYWLPIFDRIGDQVKTVIKNNKNNHTILQIDNELQYLLNIVGEVKEYNNGK